MKINKITKEDLIKKYPKMFPLDEEGHFTAVIPFGFESVWLEHLDKLMECIQNYLDNNQHLHIPQVEVHQIKEKYGGLRFYYGGGDELIRGMVWLAEFQSHYICEKCGKPGTFKESRGWYLTLCDKCRIKNEARFK